MDQSTEYQSKTVPNHHILVWHVRRRLADRLHLFGSKDWQLLHEADNGGLTKKARRLFFGSKAEKHFEAERKEEKRLAPFVLALFEIPGVQGVTVDQYDFSVEKGELFTWGEISPQVEEILEKYLAK